MTVPSSSSVRLVRLLVIGLCLLIASCTSLRWSKHIEDYEDAIEQLEDQLAADSTDVEALQELGIIYLRTGHPRRAHEVLSAAYAQDDEDAKTVFVLGLAKEALDEKEAALRLYEQYPRVSRLSPYRRRMRGRYEGLIREQVQATLRQQIQREDAMALPVTPELVAVFPMHYQGDDEQHLLLGRGLAELLTLDLASVDRLRVVERVRLQVLFDELELGQHPAVDPRTAPRLGRLLGAGRVIGGGYNVLDDDELRVDAALIDVAEASVEHADHSGVLEDVFRLEKELVFDLLEDKMGLVLTPEERQRIEDVPTQNLQAFLAYSRGLEAEDEGSLEEALRHYRQASELDPEFQEARDRIEAVEGTMEVSGTTAEALMPVLAETPPSVGTPDLLGERIRSLNEGIGSTYVPGPDAREPAPEATSRIGIIPVPPDPPPRGQ